MYTQNNVFGSQDTFRYTLVLSQQSLKKYVKLKYKYLT